MCFFVFLVEVIRNFEPIVRDTVTMPGNVAVFDCHIPGVIYNENNALPESVAITSWVQDGVFNIFPTWEIGKSVGRRPVCKSLFFIFIIAAKAYGVFFFKNSTKW